MYVANTINTLYLKMNATVCLTHRRLSLTSPVLVSYSGMQVVFEREKLISITCVSHLVQQLFFV